MKCTSPSRLSCYIKCSSQRVLERKKVVYPVIQQLYGFNGQAVVNHAVRCTTLKVSPDSQVSQRVRLGGFQQDCSLSIFKPSEKEKFLSGTQPYSHLPFFLSDPMECVIDFDSN